MPEDFSLLCCIYSQPKKLVTEQVASLIPSVSLVCSSQNATQSLNLLLLHCGNTMTALSPHVYDCFGEQAADFQSSADIQLPAQPG